MVADLIRALQASNKEIAEAVGVSERTVQRWKGGWEISGPNKEALCRFALERIERLSSELQRF